MVGGVPMSECFLTRSRAEHTRELNGLITYIRARSRAWARARPWARRRRGRARLPVGNVDGRPHRTRLGGAAADVAEARAVSRGSVVIEKEARGPGHGSAHARACWRGEGRRPSVVVDRIQVAKQQVRHQTPSVPALTVRARLLRGVAPGEILRPVAGITGHARRHSSRRPPAWAVGVGQVAARANGVGIPSIGKDGVAYRIAACVQASRRVRIQALMWVGVGVR